MTPSEFGRVVEGYIIREPRQRIGQAFFNAAADRWPEVVEPLRGGPDDPFYDSRRITAFMSRLRAAGVFSE